jgi:MFS family permease
MTQGSRYSNAGFRLADQENCAMQTTTLNPEYSPQSAGVWAPSYRRLTAGLLILIAGIAFEALAVATTLPITARELGGLALYGWAFSAFMLTNLVGITLAGSDIDRRGPARALLIGVGVFVLGLLIAGLAPSMPALVAGRAVQGFGAGFIATTSYVMIGRGFPDALRPRMLALTSSAWVIPGIVGPAIAGLVAEALDWRWVFLLLIPLFPLAVWLVAPALRPLGRSDAAPVDWRRLVAAVRVAVGAALALAALSADYVPLGLGLFVAGALLATPAVTGLLPRGTLRAAPGLPAAIATASLLHYGFFGADAFVPLTLTIVRGLPSVVTGIALTGATVSWTLGAWLQARLIERLRRRTLVLVGVALMLLGIAGFASALLPAFPVALAIGAWALTGLGMGLAFSTTSLVVLEESPQGEEGAASAALQLAGGLAIALATGVGGALIGRGTTAALLTPGLLLQLVITLAVLSVTVLAARRLS